MDIRFPTGISEFELYKISSNAISEYNLDSVNSDEFLIRSFNKLAYIVGVTVDKEFNEGVEKVFTQKGSFQSVIELLKLMKMPGEVKITQDQGLIVDIKIEEVRDTAWAPYLIECINFLIFYGDISLYIKKLLRYVEFKCKGDLVAIGVNVYFSEIENML